MVAVGEGSGEGIIREFGMDMYTLLYLKWVTSKVLLHSTGNSAQCYAAAWLGAGFGGVWIYVQDFPHRSVVKHLPANVGDLQETRVLSLGQEDNLEEEMATHSSILAWKSPWTEELGGDSPWGCKELDVTEPLNTHTLYLK